MTLTKPQRYMLEFLELRDRASPRNPTVKPRVGMLRMMEERGLVSRNSHGEWSITRAGRAALPPLASGEEKGRRADKDALASASARTVEQSAPQPESGDAK